LKKYASLIEILEKNKFQSIGLQFITKTLISNRSSAARSIKHLSKLVSAFDNRMNLLAALFLEGILLWDIQCMVRLEKWKLKEGIFFDRWINALAEFDVLASLATYAFNHPGYVYAIVDNTPVFEAKELGHVLIPKHERVCNDFIIQNEKDFIIITGANMAGKSTFLRTVATSMIIAMTGAPVCATSYRFRPMPVFSSMRTSDSLNKHESYFYAELKRLKEMLDRLREGKKLFIILDEILKGTNSRDKQKGSYAALEQIIKLGGTGIIATHDLELAKIEDKYPERIKNLCFEIEIDQAKISFDYKLKEGITTKMNASLLMQQMGIIE
jgi:DNA mismatch repair ATPase MutS